ncbi:unnamed protein product [Arabidopsis lyrata]|uniref:DUF7903 domain-containing protein n=1 Tax=Arabidopsis lyrata subsp. lyrata TaxID=81972 RepID=D7LLJ9_ARALL|nr:hypothetical protein ARALYDRAFT_345623 [Arabidopsis lyrata subsp. lyrata]CAH8265187.1 unnamed protein product [Arabidopsis lyrata]
MSYIPPHKRHLNPARPAPVPDSLIPTFKKNLEFKSKNDKRNNIIYSGDSISKWFLVGSIIILSYKIVNMDMGEKEEERTQWQLVAEKVEKDLDMRLMLAAKRKITYLSEKEIGDIKALLESATVDPNVKGGLKWPFGKALTKDGYREFEVCHVRATIYKNKTLRLRVRETDRFNERSGTGEIKREVSLTLKDIDTKLQEQNMERACVVEMLRDALGTIWDFLHCDAYIT